MECVRKREREKDLICCVTLSIGGEEETTGRITGVAV
jgi:hypothetical protein